MPDDVQAGRVGTVPHVRLPALARASVESFRAEWAVYISSVNQDLALSQAVLAKARRPSESEEEKQPADRVSALAEAARSGFPRVDIAPSRRFLLSLLGRGPGWDAPLPISPQPDLVPSWAVRLTAGNDIRPPAPTSRRRQPAARLAVGALMMGVGARCLRLRAARDGEPLQTSRPVRTAEAAMWAVAIGAGAAAGRELARARRAGI